MTPSRTDGGPATVRPSDALPRLIAHRGFAADAPENTPGAFRRAARHAAAVEMDVRRCGSGEPVVIHDATLDRVTDTTGRVDETPLSALQALTVRGGGRVPTLSEALAAVPPAVGVVLELKEPLVEAVCSLAVGNDLLVSSFDPDVLASVRARDGPPTALLSLPGGDAVSTAAETGCAAVHPERSMVAIDPGFVDRAHESGLAVNVWSVDGREDAARLAAAGVDGIAADRADVFDPPAE